jgi:hypothetical protein
MKKLIIPVCIVILAVFLDGRVDSLRADGVKHILLDGAPNLISAIFIPFAYFVYHKFTVDSITAGIFYCLGLVIFEFMQIYSDVGLFDWTDIYMTLVGMAFFIILRQIRVHRMKSSVTQSA